MLVVKTWKTVATDFEPFELPLKTPKKTTGKTSQLLERPGSSPTNTRKNSQGQRPMEKCVKKKYARNWIDYTFKSSESQEQPL